MKLLHEILPETFALNSSFRETSHSQFYKHLVIYPVIYSGIDLGLEVWWGRLKFSKNFKNLIKSNKI